MYAAKWVYWYGTCGYQCTQSLYNSKAKQYPSHYTASRKKGYEKDIAEGKYCADCVGMIKAFFWSGGVFQAKTKYASNGCPDKSANGMFALCTETGPISSIPDIPGLVVWKSGHIGVYIGGGYTIEMKGFDYDCKRNKVKDGPWTKWGKLPASMLAYTDEPTPEPTPEPIGERDLKNGCKGADVEQLQENLIKLGYSCGDWGVDGDFGDCTEQAVEEFQRDNGLPVTGIFDGATREKMDEELEKADEPVEEPRYVEIVGGNCYVRSAPTTENSKKLGVAHKGDVLPYGGKTSDNGWNLIDYKNTNGWVSGKYSRLIDANLKRGKKIVDISKHKEVIDYNALIRDTALIILRAGYRKSDGKIYEDEKFEAQSSELAKRGVRFGAYFYSIADTPEKAREEARAFVKYAKGKKPLFWAIDAEKPEITNEAIVAFEDEMRQQGVKKFGAYVAHHHYKDYDFDSIRHWFDFVWIPNYLREPSFKCDLWQYTSSGKVNGINEDVDLNKITGDGHTLEWFCEGE